MEQTANFYDVVVIGGGPAGLTAALYLARARYRVVVVEKDHFGGQITITSEVVNYPGVGRTSGTELTETMRKQAEGFGAEFLLAEVTGLELSGDIKTVRTGRGDLRCFGVLLATGAHPRMVGFQGEEQFRGRGVAYCATCDGEFFTGKDVFVVGGGFAAAEESVFLTKYARQVTILIRGDDFTCAQATADAARNHEKITVLTNTEVEEVSGDTSLRYLRYRNTKTGQVTKHHAADGETFGVFVFAGYEPATELVRGLAELNDQGYILTDRSQKTTADGLYAAGDVCVKPLRQVVTAVGDGALAATELEHLCAAMQEKTGIHPKAPVSRAEETAVSTETNSTLFTGGMPAQLHTVFARVMNVLLLGYAFIMSTLSLAELFKYDYSEALRAVSVINTILLAVSFVLELADMGIRFGIITASAQIASVIPGVGLGIMLLAFVFTIAELILKKDEVKPPIQLIIEEHLAKTVAALPEPPSDWEQANLALA